MSYETEALMNLLGLMGWGLFALVIYAIARPEEW